jgi:O-antigen ligase
MRVAGSRRPFPLGPIVLALAVPAIFLHITYQPAVHIGVGSTTIGFELSDAAVLAVGLAAFLEGRRHGFGALRPGRWIWLLGALFLLDVAVATFHPLLWQDHYRFLTHLVTAAKFAEYGLLALALPLLLRGRREANVLLWALVAWSAAASVWGLLQFAGVVNEFEGRRPLQREPSFVGIHDLAALSGVALAVALAVLALGPRDSGDRLLAWIGGASGSVGLVLSAAIAGALGIVIAGVVAVVLARRLGRFEAMRGSVAIALAFVTAVGVLVMRNGAITDFFHSAGIGHEAKPSKYVESEVHRSLLAYIGIRMFADHPIAGVGWQGSEELENYGPYLDDAHRRFPHEPAEAFPSPQHAWGVQNAYLQVLTDLGTLGLVLLVALFAAGVFLAGRATLRAPPELVVPALCGLLWLVVAAGVWNGLGLVAGIPLDAVTWLAFGLAATAAAWTARARA